MLVYQRVSCNIAGMSWDYSGNTIQNVHIDNMLTIADVHLCLETFMPLCVNR
jgi:hypothetical protein